MTMYKDISELSETELREEKVMLDSKSLIARLDRIELTLGLINFEEVSRLQQLTILLNKIELRKKRVRAEKALTESKGLISGEIESGNGYALLILESVTQTLTGEIEKNFSKYE
jgi:hypothetical protein